MRIGFVGCGFIANVHSWAIWAVRKAGIADARVTAVSDIHRDRAAAFAERVGASAVDHDALIGSVDAVYVCTPTAFHLATVEACAEAGVPVMCEKPLARDLAGAIQVARELERVPHQVGLVLRCAPVFLELKERIASGVYGRPMAVQLLDDQFFPIQGHYASTWRADRGVAGGGTMIEHSIHDVDLLAWIFGDPTSVSGRTASFFGHEGIEDLAHVTFSYERSELISSITSVWHQVMSRASTRRLDVFCEAGHLSTSSDTAGPLDVETSEGKESIQCPRPAWVEGLPIPEEAKRGLGSYAEASRRFIEAVRDGGGLLHMGVGAGAALRAHEVVEATYASARAGGEVKIVARVRS